MILVRSWLTFLGSEASRTLFELQNTPSDTSCVNFYPFYSKQVVSVCYLHRAIFDIKAIVKMTLTNFSEYKLPFKLLTNFKTYTYITISNELKTAALIRLAQCWRTVSSSPVVFDLTTSRFGAKAKRHMNTLKANQRCSVSRHLKYSASIRRSIN